jgi:hypothetical protein
VQTTNLTVHDLLGGRDLGGSVIGRAVGEVIGHDEKNAATTAVFKSDKRRKKAEEIGDDEVGNVARRFAMRRVGEGQQEEAGQSVGTCPLT